MKRTTAALTLVAVVGAGLFAARRGLGLASGKGKSETDVQLTIQNGVCSAKAPVDDLGGDRLFKNKIRWNVKNVDCDIPQYVAFMEYRERPNLGSPEHVVDPDPAYSKQLARGDSDKVDAAIDKFNWNPFDDEVFKYKICVGPNPQPTTNCLDPDVDVWPF